MGRFPTLGDRRARSIDMIINVKRRRRAVVTRASRCSFAQARHSWPSRCARRGFPIARGQPLSRIYCNRMKVRTRVKVRRRRPRRSTVVSHLQGDAALYELLGSPRRDTRSEGYRRERRSAPSPPPLMFSLESARAQAASAFPRLRVARGRGSTVSACACCSHAARAITRVFSRAAPARRKVQQCNAPRT